MIDSDLFDKLDPEMRSAVEISLGILGECGLIREQMDRDQENLLQGSDEQEESELAKQIKVFRVRTQTLQSLQDLCDKLKKEQTT